MILRSSISYWTVGITVCWRSRSGSRNGEPTSGWSASLDFLDDGFTNDDADSGQVSTQGRLETRYAVSDGARASGLSVAIDTLIADAQRLGITFGGPAGPPYLFYFRDGEDKMHRPPAGWRHLLATEAARIGWTSAHGAGR